MGISKILPRRSECGTAITFILRLPGPKHFYSLIFDRQSPVPCWPIEVLLIQSLLAKHIVLFTQNDNFRPVRTGLRVIEQSKTHDRQSIAWLPEVRGGSIQRNRTLAANPIDYVCFKSLAVPDVSDQDALVLFEFDQFRKIGGDA
jgi:hypothetical protein